MVVVLMAKHYWNMTAEERVADDARKARIYYINGVAVRDSGYEHKPEMITQMRNEIVRTSVKMDEYGNGDCDDNENVYCPYCKHSQEDWWESLDPRLEDEEQEHECHSCERTFLAKANFGSGWTTKPQRCRNKAHQFEVTRQYFYDNRVWRVAECKNCFEHKSHYTKDDEPAFALLPWKPEYNNPDYFDPKGTLKSSAVYGQCKHEDCGCGFSGKLIPKTDGEPFGDEESYDWYACPECGTEVEPCNILELELKSPVLDQVFKDIAYRAYQKQYGII